MKRIAICCDGTWNQPDSEKNGVPVATNVVKVAQAIRRAASDAPQAMYYDAGIGTSGRSLRRVFDGATGTGLSRNILEAYRYLVHNYEEGDELFFFGFSRGAFTVRSLAGLIRKCGILRPSAIEMVDHAFALYRSRADASHPREKEATLFRRTYAVSDVTRIKFIGVWDTVGALGNPLLLNFNPWNKFHDTDLSSTVENAFHALAIDEKRYHFSATLWHQQGDVPGQRLEQVWFVGVHSCVGGGYVDTGLSDIALDWMVEKARECGLDLDPIESHPNPLGPCKESRSGAYQLLPPFHRPIAATVSVGKRTNESLHPSVMERYRADNSYRPENLQEYLARHPGTH